jgi:hypothetical protein
LRSCTLLLALLLAPLAHADVIHLATGRTVKGTVVSEVDGKVVVKTPEGKLTFPAKLVLRIERQTKGELHLALARERAQQGAFELALELYARAAKAGNPRIARPAAEERAILAHRVEEISSREEEVLPPPRRGTAVLPRGRSAAELPPLWGGGFVETVRAREVVLALREDDARAALELLDGARAKYAEDRSFRYLEARAAQHGRRLRKARALYTSLLAGTGVNERMSVAQLNELARRSVAGPQVERLGEDSPGVGSDWRRVESAHFTVYHRFETPPAWFATAAEEALAYDLKTLEIRASEVTFSGRIQVFMFESNLAYREGGGMKLAGGHAQMRYSPDGYLKTINAYPVKNMAITTFRHEIAHTVLLELYTAMPAWAHEGAAVFVEAAPTRGRYRSIYVRREQARTLHRLLDFLRGESPRGKTKAAVVGYYAQASVTFEALISLCNGPREALALCVRMGRSGVGPARALAEVGLSLAKLEVACAKVVAKKSGRISSRAF